MFCPYCKLNTAGQHEAHCLTRRWQHDLSTSDTALQDGFYVYGDGRCVWEYLSGCDGLDSEGIRPGIL